MTREILVAPAYAALPPAKPRSTRGGPELAELSVHIKVVTPILGGGVLTRSLDDVDVIRVPSVRGHLRFWWRALYAQMFANAEELHRRESALWGRAAKDDGGRSAVEVRVVVTKVGVVDDRPIQLVPGNDQTPGAYALWPARGVPNQDKPTASRRQSDTRFQLTLKVAVNDKAEVENAVRAWLLFGGYGGRTRRGLGSLQVTKDASMWLPSSATRAALEGLFGSDIFASPLVAVGDVSWIGGGSFHVGSAVPDAQTAWTTALDWLKDFRQGTTGSAAGRAREPGTGKTQSHRPSISNWPEADKIRHIHRKTRSHTPNHNAAAAWPRAGFGLPIHGQFQTTDRNNNRHAYDEPAGFELRWRAHGVTHDRLASPLIVKALPLANGTFVPCALWLNRAYPANSEVFLRGVDNSQAPFARLVAPGDTARFSALAGKSSLRAAFLDWLHEHPTHRTTVVAP